MPLILRTLIRHYSKISFTLTYDTKITYFSRVPTFLWSCSAFFIFFRKHVTFCHRPKNKFFLFSIHSTFRGRKKFEKNRVLFYYYYCYLSGSNVYRIFFSMLSKECFVTICFWWFLLYECRWSYFWKILVKEFKQFTWFSFNN